MTDFNVATPPGDDPVAGTAGELKDKVVSTVEAGVYAKLVLDQWLLREEQRRLERSVLGPAAPTARDRRLPPEPFIPGPPGPGDPDRLLEGNLPAGWDQRTTRQFDVLTAPIGVMVRTEEDGAGVVTGTVDADGRLEVALLNENRIPRNVPLDDDINVRRYRFEDLVLIDNMTLPPAEISQSDPAHRFLENLHPEALERHRSRRAAAATADSPGPALPKSSWTRPPVPGPERKLPATPQQPGQADKTITERVFGPDPTPRPSRTAQRRQQPPRFRPRNGGGPPRPRPGQ